MCNYYINLQLADFLAILHETSMWNDGWSSMYFGEWFLIPNWQLIVCISIWIESWYWKIPPFLSFRSELKKIHKKVSRVLFHVLTLYVYTRFMDCLYERCSLVGAYECDVIMLNDWMSSQGSGLMISVPFDLLLFTIWELRWWCIAGRGTS